MNKEGYKKTELGYLPLDWDVKKLGEIANNVTIGLVKTMTAHYCEQGVPLIRNSNIKEDKIDKENMVFLTYEFAEANENKRLKVGDIVTVHTGDIGTSAVIEKDMDGAHGFATLNTTVNPEIIYNYYLSKYFNSNMYKKQAMSFSTGDGRFNLNLKDFVNSLISIPPLKEQKKIAEILSSVDAAIEKTEQVIAKTEEVKKGLMQQLLTKGIGHAEFKQSEIGKIPVNWGASLLGSVCEIDPSYKIPKGSNCDFVEMAAVQSNNPEIAYFNKKEYGKNSGSKFKNGDILFARITPCTENGKTAVVSNLSSEFGLGSTELIVFSPNDMNSKYVYYLLKLDSIRNKAISRMVGTTGRQRVPKEIFKEEIFIPVPPRLEQDKIVEILESFESRVKINSDYLQRLVVVKQGLLQQLLTGKTRVKVD